LEFQKEGAAVLDALQDIVHVDVGGTCGRHEVRGVHQIGGLDGMLAETQVGHGDAARDFLES
jgi:hypothetical protein